MISQTTEERLSVAETMGHLRQEAARSACPFPTAQFGRIANAWPNCASSKGYFRNAITYIPTGDSSPEACDGAGLAATLPAVWIGAHAAWVSEGPGKLPGVQ